MLCKKLLSTMRIRSMTPAIHQNAHTILMGSFNDKESIQREQKNSLECNLINTCSTN